MVDRRTFTTLLAATIAAPKTTFAQGSTMRNVFHSAVGLSFVRKYDIDASTSKQQFWAGMVTLLRTGFSCFREADF